MTSEQQSSTSSDVTEPSIPWPAVASLGHKIVTELELADSNKTLMRWMAHRIAEFMECIEQSPSGQSEPIKRECTDLIIRLWEHRSEWRDHYPIETALRHLRATIGTQYRTPQDEHDTDPWLAVAAKLRGFYQEENEVCWDLFLLQFPREDVERDLTSYDHKEFLSEDEQATYDLFKEIFDRVYAANGLGSLNGDARRENVAARLEDIASHRRVLIDSVLTNIDHEQSSRQKVRRKRTKRTKSNPAAGTED